MRESGSSIGERPRWRGGRDAAAQMQRLAGAVQAMIDQGRKGGLQGMMFHALGHGIDSFVGGPLHLHLTTLSLCRLVEKSQVPRGFAGPA